MLSSRTEVLSSGLRLFTCGVRKSMSMNPACVEEAEWLTELLALTNPLSSVEGAATLNIILLFLLHRTNSDSALHTSAMNPNPQDSFGMNQQMGRGPLQRNGESKRTHGKRVRPQPKRKYKNETFLTKRNLLKKFYNIHSSSQGNAPEGPFCEHTRGLFVSLFMCLLCCVLDSQHELWLTGEE